jgi:hypothetical protein
MSAFWGTVTDPETWEDWEDEVPQVSLDDGELRLDGIPVRVED